MSGMSARRLFRRRLPLKHLTDSKNSWSLTCSIKNAQCWQPFTESVNRLLACASWTGQRFRTREVPRSHSLPPSESLSPLRVEQAQIRGERSGGDCDETIQADRPGPAGAGLPATGANEASETLRIKGVREGPATAPPVTRGSALRAPAVMRPRAEPVHRGSRPIAPACQARRRSDEGRVNPAVRASVTTGATPLVRRANALSFTPPAAASARAAAATCVPPPPPHTIPASVRCL